MYKNWIVLLIFLLLIGFSLWHTLYLDDSSGSLSDLASHLNQAAIDEDEQSAKDYSDQLLSAWLDIRPIWGAIIETQDIDPINTAVLAAYSNAQLGDMGELRVQTDLLLDELAFIEQMSDITVENIF